MKGLVHYRPVVHDSELIGPNSDQHQISPCNINAYSTPEVMRIKNMITQGEFSWYFNNFYKKRLGTR